MSSQMQMVTLRQPATIPSLLGHSFDLPIANVLQYEVMWLTIHQSSRLRTQPFGRDPKLLALASTWPTLASTEALLTVELPQAVRPDRYTHRSTNSTKCGGSGAREPWATMSYPSSNLLQEPSNCKGNLRGRNPCNASD